MGICFRLRRPRSSSSSSSPILPSPKLPHSSGTAFMLKAFPPFHRNPLRVPSTPVFSLDGLAHDAKAVPQHPGTPWSASLHLGQVTGSWGRQCSLKTGGAGVYPEACASYVSLLLPMDPHLIICVPSLSSVRPRSLQVVHPVGRRLFNNPINGALVPSSGQRLKYQPETTSVQHCTISSGHLFISSLCSSTY